MNEQQITLTLPLPVSVNQAYSWFRIRHKSEKYKLWIELATIELRKQTKYRITGDNWLLVDYDFHFPIFNKNGSKKVKDVANYEKALSDFLADNITGFEDHKIKMIVMKKTDSKESYVNIKIKELWS